MRADGYSEMLVVRRDLRTPPLSGMEILPEEGPVSTKMYTFLVLLSVAAYTYMILTLVEMKTS